MNCSGTPRAQNGVSRAAAGEVSKPVRDGQPALSSLTNTIGPDSPTQTCVPFASKPRSQVLIEVASIRTSLVA